MRPEKSLPKNPVEMKLLRPLGGNPTDPLARPLLYLRGLAEQIAFSLDGF
jgi:hypothetical protein